MKPIGGRSKKMSISLDSNSLRGDDLLKLVSDIVAAYVSNNPVPISEVPGMIKSIHATLGTLSGLSSSDTLTSQSRQCRLRSP